MELHHIKAYIAETEKAIDAENKTITFTIPEIVDRDDEIVAAHAIFDAINDRKSFAANPICLPCHQHRLEGGEPPCVGSWDIESAKQLKNAVNINLKFAVGTKLGDAYWNCYANRHMRAISIGFRTKDFSMEDRNGRQIRIITKIELYEISCVAVGCNPGALSQLKSIGDWQDIELTKDVEDKFKKIAEKLFDEKTAELKAEIEDLKLLVIPDSGGFAEELLATGDDSEPSASAGKDNKSGQNALGQILKVIEKFKE